MRSIIGLLNVYAPKKGGQKKCTRQRKHYFLCCKSIRSGQTHRAARRGVAAWCAARSMRVAHHRTRSIRVASKSKKSESTWSRGSCEWKGANRHTVVIIIRFGLVFEQGQPVMANPGPLAHIPRAVGRHWSTRLRLQLRGGQRAQGGTLGRAGLGIATSPSSCGQDIDKSSHSAAGGNLTMKRFSRSKTAYRHTMPVSKPDPSS